MAANWKAVTQRSTKVGEGQGVDGEGHNVEEEWCVAEQIRSQGCGMKIVFYFLFMKKCEPLISYLPRVLFL